MQLPTINSQNCFRVAYLVIYFFTYAYLCWWQRGKASAIQDVFSMSDTVSAWGGFTAAPQVQQPSYRARTLSLHWHLGCEECRGGWDVVLCQWDSDSPAPWGSPLEHQKGSGRAPPGWSHREDTAESLPTWPQIPLEDGP